MLEFVCAKEASPYQLLENIKLLSYWWFKAQFIVYYHYKFHDCCKNPFLCLGAG